jgi:hypothetical protein
MIGKKMNEQFEEIELNIQEAKKLAGLGDALDRLTDNRDFIAVIREGYFKDEAVRLVQTKAAPGAKTEVIQAGITRSIDAIGELYQYFGKIEHQADLARMAISEGEEALSEMAEQGEL